MASIQGKKHFHAEVNLGVAMISSHLLKHLLLKDAQVSDDTDFNWSINCYRYIYILYISTFITIILCIIMIVVC